VPRKTLADLKQQPRHVTPQDLLAIFALRGWRIRPGKHLLPVYVRRAIRLIEEVE